MIWPDAELTQTHLSARHRGAGAYDHEDDVVYLPAETTRIVDLGDADIIHTDTVQNHANIETAVRKILAKAMGLAKTRLTLIRGATSRDKTFRVD